ncbi:MAG TPA: DUF2786 domain-containing protein [Thermomicrobiales bacterium]|nr:DUF2786 domain-containing protein [Thermomicrobiales bacterium]
MVATVDQANLDRVLERVEKLLALSTSSNPNEAALAASKAQDLMFKYNIETHMLRGTERGSEFKNMGFEVGDAAWRRRLVGAVARTNFCKCIIITGTDDVELVGETHNIVIVSRLYAYLEREIARLADEAWRKERRSGQSARTWKDSFRHGAVDTVARRLKEQREASVTADEQTMAIVVVKDRELEEAYRKFHPHVRSLNLGAGRDGAARYAGQRAGEGIALNTMIGR